MIDPLYMNTADQLNHYLNVNLHNKALVAAKIFAEAHGNREMATAKGEPEEGHGDFMTRYAIAEMALRNALWSVIHDAFEAGARQHRIHGKGAL
jgi:hypothetical protein